MKIFWLLFCKPRKRILFYLTIIFAINTLKRNFTVNSSSYKKKAAYYLENNSIKFQNYMGEGISYFRGNYASF